MCFVVYGIVGFLRGVVVREWLWCRRFRLCVFLCVFVSVFMCMFVLSGSSQYNRSGFCLTRVSVLCSC